MVLCTKSSILLAGTGVWKISSVACGCSSIKIQFSDLKFMFFSIKYGYSDILLKKNVDFI